MCVKKKNSNLIANTVLYLVAYHNSQKKMCPSENTFSLMEILLPTESILHWKEKANAPFGRYENHKIMEPHCDIPGFQIFSFSPPLAGPKM
jgi:hypothetical protein